MNRLQHDEAISIDDLMEALNEAKKELGGNAKVSVHVSSNIDDIEIGLESTGIIAWNDLPKTFGLHIDGEDFYISRLCEDEAL